jgi:hypothetical protein
LISAELLAGKQKEKSKIFNEDFYFLYAGDQCKVASAGNKVEEGESGVQPPFPLPDTLAHLFR